jgi:hypothetical protein
LLHFFEAEVRNQFTAIENVFVQRTSPSKKRGCLCFAAMEMVTLPSRSLKKTLYQGIKARGKKFFFREGLR